MSAAVCFTGIGEYRGKKVTRDHWVDAAQKMGWVVTNAKHCEILVASRNDTTKMAEATRRGATIMTYDDFIGEMVMAGHEYFAGERIGPESWRISEPQAQAKVDDAAMEQMEQSPLFGLF